MLLETLILWLHLIALGLGGAAVFGIPVVASAMDGASNDARAVLNGRVEALGKIGSAALGLIIVTGLGILGLRGGIGGDPVWFWIKMALVVAFVVTIALAKRTGAAAMTGDQAAAGRLKALSMLEFVLFALVILVALLTFG
ncbi:MAG: hypothetical protein Kow0013_27070 [Pararhodobacter sp.]